MRMGTAILVVDDDRAILKSFEEILKSEGYDVDTAETGLEAIQRSRKKYYNIALLDIKLPDMEGTELLTKLHEDIPRMIKIMITGHASLENAVRALNLGADAYLMKPVNPEELLRVIADKLREQAEAEEMGQEQARRWIQSRIRKLQSR